MQRKRPEDKSMTWQPRGAVRLYLDDVDEILATAARIPGSVAVETDEYKEITSTDDLRQIPATELRNLVVSAGSEGRALKLELNRSTKLYISSRDDLDLVGAFERTKRLIEARERWFGSWAGWGEVWYLLLGLVVALAYLVRLVVSSIAGLSDAVSVVSYVALLIAPVTWWTVAGRSPQPSTQVVLATRSEAPTWWQQNRTAILINMVTSSVFFLLGLVIG